MPATRVGIFLSRTMRVARSADTRYRSGSRTSWVSGLSNPLGIAVSGSNLFVANHASGTIGEYDITTGQAVNMTLVSGLGANNPQGIVVSGSDLFVANLASGTIGEYNAISGATINASLVTGLSGRFYCCRVWITTVCHKRVQRHGRRIHVGSHAWTLASSTPSFVSGLNGETCGLAVSGSNLFVVNSWQGSGTIGEYDITTGQAVNTALVSGLNNPLGLAVSGSNLFVTNWNYHLGSFGPGTIGEYDIATGQAVNTALVSGSGEPWGIA